MGRAAGKKKWGRKGALGASSICAVFRSAVKVFSWPPGHWPASSAASLWGTLYFTHHSASNFVPFLNSISGSSPLSVPLSKILLPSSLCDQLLPPFRPQFITHLGRVTFPMTSLPKVLPPRCPSTFHHIPGSVVHLLSYFMPKWSPSHCPHWSMSSLRKEIWLS